MKLKIPNKYKNRKGVRGRTKTCTIAEVMPYVPRESGIVNIRNWGFWRIKDGIMPFAVTTRLSTNDQQYLIFCERIEE